jgi:hypothetical protein
VDWIGLAQDRNRWRVLVNSVLNLLVPSIAGKLSIVLTTEGLSSGAQLLLVSYIDGGDITSLRNVGKHQLENTASYFRIENLRFHKLNALKIFFEQEKNVLFTSLCRHPFLFWNFHIVNHKLLQSIHYMLLKCQCLPVRVQ